MTGSIHHNAQTGFSRESRTYERGRPGYPAEVDAWLVEQVGLRRGRTAIDLGAGTGKFTSHLAACGAEVVAVEPVDEMRAVLKQNCPGVRAVAGTAETIPMPDGSADAVVCAQAFHWFATSAALGEIRRVLKPGGVLGLVWNVRDEATEWVAALGRIMVPYEDGTPRFHSDDWRSVFPAPGFSPLREQSFVHHHRGSYQAVVIDRVLSVSFIAALPPAEKDRVVSQLNELPQLYPALSDPADVAFPYRTLAVATTRD